MENDTVIRHAEYLLELLQTYDMTNSKMIFTLMMLHILIYKYAKGVEMHIKNYRGLIGYLIYLTTIRLDIMFSVCMCSRVQVTLGESHFKTVKRNLRCLNRISHQSLWFPKGSTCSLVGFSDFDFTGCKSYRKSTSGTCHISRNCLLFMHN